MAFYANILAALIVLAFVFYLFYGQNQRLIQERGLRGVHGWLVILVVSIFVKALVMLYQIYMIVAVYTYQEKQVYDLPVFQSYRSSIEFMGIGALALSLVAMGVLIWMRRPITPKVAMALLWISGPLVGAFVYFKGVSTFPDVPVVPWSITNLLIIPIVYALITSWYLWRSRRVNNTYGLS